MKKKKFIFLITLTISLCMGMSCSNDEYSDNSMSVEKQVENLKQRFLYFAKQYGVTNIGFDDNLLKQHLNLTDMQIEMSIIRMAVASGLLNKDASTIRKKYRTRSLDDENNTYYEYTEVRGQFSDTKVFSDSISANYTIDFFKNGYGAYSCTNCTATLSRKLRNESAFGPTWISDPNVYIPNTICTITHFIGSIPKENGTAIIDVRYHLTLSYDNEFIFNGTNDATYHGAIANVTVIRS